MPRYFLDTNICVYAWHRRDERVLARMRQIPVKDLVISALVAAELAYGAMRSARPEHNRRVLESTLELFTVQPWSADAMWHYATWAARLRQTGRPIGPLDLLIASQALADPEGILVTHNVREFERIEGLRIEDWTAA